MAPHLELFQVPLDGHWSLTCVSSTTKLGALCNLLMVCAIPELMKIVSLQLLWEDMPGGITFTLPYLTYSDYVKSI